MDCNKPRVRVTIHSSIAEEWSNVGRPVCHMVRGFLAGMVQYMADEIGKKEKIVGKEIKCIAKGDEYCEYVAEPFRL